MSSSSTHSSRSNVILTIQTRHQEVRSCQTTARSQEIRKTDSSSKDQTEGDGQEIFPGQGTGCQEEYVSSILQSMIFADETERSEGAELGDEFDIDIDNSEDKPQRGGASARGARGRGGKTSVSPSVQPPLPSFQLPHTHDLLLTFASPSLSIFGYPYHRTIISSCPLHLLPFFLTP
jgi:hypothetical protein